MVNPEKGEGLRQAAEVTASFGTYADEQVARYNGLSDFLTENLPIAEDLDQCNGALEAAGRPDLTITERAEMLRVDSPAELRNANDNFRTSFIMHSGMAEAPEGSSEPLTLKPMTTEDILAMRDFPKITSLDQYKDLQESGEFVIPRNFVMTHITKTAFLRMLVLHPVFTTDLVTKSTKMDEEGYLGLFEPEQFVAYQMMSRLVDAGDYNVGGASDSWYLYR